MNVRNRSHHAKRWGGILPLTLALCLTGCGAKSEGETASSNAADAVDDALGAVDDAAGAHNTAEPATSSSTPTGSSENIEQCLTRFSKAWLWSEEAGLDVKACPPEVQNAYHDWSLTQEESIRVNAEFNRIESEGGDTKAAQSAVYKARNSQSDAEKALKDILKAMGYSSAGIPDEDAH